MGSVRVRVIFVAVLAALALLWWLSQDGAETSRTTRRESRAIVDRALPNVAPEPRESDSDGAAGTAAEAAEVEEPIDPDFVIRGRVQVRGREDAPVAGVRFIAGSGRLMFTAPTDDMGWTEWSSNLPLVEGQVIVDSLLGISHKVELPVTTIRFPNLIPLTVEFIDVENGTVLEDGAISLPPEIAKTVHGATLRTLLFAPIVAGTTCNFRLLIKPPEGGTGEHGGHEFVRSIVSARAHAAHLRIPIWPAATLVLRVYDAAHQPIVGIRIHSIELHGRPIQFTAAATDSWGQTHVRGIPFIRDATLRVRMEGDTDKFHSLRIRRKRMFLRIDGRARGASSTTIPDIDVPGSLQAPQVGKGVLNVEVRWGDRLIAGNVKVVAKMGEFEAAALTDPDTGIARFENVPFGDVRVAIREPALAYKERVISLHPKRLSTETIGPARGRSIHFVVTGGYRKLGVAGARIYASAWHGEIAPPFVDGVQQLAAITGTGGTFIWHGFPLGAVDIDVERGRETGLSKVRAGARTDREAIFLTRRK